MEGLVPNAAWAHRALKTASRHARKTGPLPVSAPVGNVGRGVMMIVVHDVATFNASVVVSTRPVTGSSSYFDGGLQAYA